MQSKTMVFSSYVKMPTLERNPLTAPLMAPAFLVIQSFQENFFLFFFFLHKGCKSYKQFCNSGMALKQLLRCNLTLKSHKSSGNTVWSRNLVTYLYLETMPCRLPQESMNYVQYKKTSTFRRCLKATSLGTEDNTYFICLPPKGGTAKHSDICWVSNSPHEMTISFT